MIQILILLISMISEVQRTGMKIGTQKMMTMNRSLMLIAMNN